jgi:uncharacterized protein YceK
MRLTVLIVTVFLLSGCSAMLLGGSAETEKRSDCTEKEREAQKDGC